MPFIKMTAENGETRLINADIIREAHFDPKGLTLVILLQGNGGKCLLEGVEAQKAFEQLKCAQ